MEETYRVGEFAALTGVSVRTLHHYDQIGLLPPSGRTEAGYRLYSTRDLLTLQQVLTLRYLGFSLDRVRELLAQPDFDLVASMWAQRTALRARIAELERIAETLGTLVNRRLASGGWDWALIASASAAVQEGLTHTGAENMERYYTPEQMAQFAKLGQEVSTEEREAVEQEWTTLLADVRAGRDLDLASAEAQALLARWDAATARTASYYQAYPELWQAIGDNYRQGKFEGHAQAPQSDDFRFIERIRQAQGGGAS